MKTPVTAVAATLATLLLISPVNGQDWSLSLLKIPHIVYQLESKNGDEGGHCSAVVIADDVVVTAGHCVPDKPEGRSIVVDEKHADVVKHNTVLDLAVLRVPGLGGKPVLLRRDDITPGLPISVIGFGFAAHRLKYGFGWVADARDNSLRNAGDRLYFSAAGVVPGDSGGAVVDYAGRLCTIVQGVLFAGPSSLAYGSPTSVIDDFVKSFIKVEKQQP